MEIECKGQGRGHARLAKRAVSVVTSLMGREPRYCRTMRSRDDDSTMRSPRPEDSAASPLPLHLLADELRSIANEELHWGHPDEYARRRCERLIRIAAEIASLGDERVADTIEDQYRGDLLHLTPYSGGDAAIFDDAGRVLLIRRKDSGLWAMPGGVFEIGETPAEATRREVREETGLHVEVLALSGVYDSRYCGTRSAYHLYHFVFLCRQIDPDATPTVSNETTGVGWFSLDALPELHAGHEKRLRDAILRLQGKLIEAIFDRVT